MNTSQGSAPGPVTPRGTRNVPVGRQPWKPGEWL